jgi:hypothetical protein
VFSACFVVCVCPWFVGEVCVVERVSMWLGGMQRWGTGGGLKIVDSTC